MKFMEVASVIGTLALIALVSTVGFILLGKEIPREWWLVVMASIMSKIFGDSKKNGGGGNAS